MSHSAPVDSSISRSFILAIILTAVTLVAEVAGGLWTNSLALLSDAAHVFMDIFALVLSLLANRLAQRPATDTRTFGLHRLEILASLTNGLTLLLMSAGILYEAWGRILQPQAVRSKEMFIIAIVGLVMNLIAASVLHRHSEDDLNVRSAFLHVVGDAAASVGVIGGGIFMAVTGHYIADPLISIAIALIIVYGAWRILREALHILLEGVPVGIELQDVVREMQTVDGVQGVHHLHLWSICSHLTFLAAHIDLDPQWQGRGGSVVAELEHRLADRFHIHHTTLQIECSRCRPGVLMQQLTHRQRHGGCQHGHGHHGHHHD